VEETSVWLRLLDARLQIGLATLAGLFLRLWHLASVPPGLNQDEAVYGYDAYSILMTGRDHLGHPFPFASLETFGDWSSPLLTYLSIPAIALFGLHVEVLRGVSAVIGVLCVPVVYLFGAGILKRPSIGTVSAWLLAVLPWSVHLSRWAIIPTVVPTMVAATMLVLAWSLQEKNDRGVVAAALLAGLTVAAYHAMKIYVPVLLVAAAIVYWPYLRRMRLEPLAYAAIVFLVIAGPILYLTWRDPGGGARIAQTSVLRDHDLTPGLVVRQYTSYFSPRLWFVSGDGDPMHLPPEQGLAPKTLAPILIMGLAGIAYLAVLGKSNPCRRGARFLLCAIALYPIAGMLTLPNPHVLRAAHVIPLAALTGGVGTIALADAAQSLLQAKRPSWNLTNAGVLAIGVGVLILGGELWQRYDSYFNEYPDEVAEKFRTGIREALVYADQHADDYDEIWLDDNNSSYIYVLFYKRWDPSDVHRDLVVIRNPPDWNRTVSIGKYRFGRPENLRDKAHLFTSRFRNGTAAYEVSDGTSGLKRILLVEHVAPP
jgi:4-amino-4-deoxy-L-arabinose transferase-like glycosyltransferase